MSTSTITPYDLAVVSWDGDPLQTSDYEAVLEDGADVLGTVAAQARDVQRPFGAPKTVGIDKQGKAYPVHIYLKSTDQGKLNALKQAFAACGTQKYLRLTDGYGAVLRVACVCLGISYVNPVEFVARLWADDGSVESEEEYTDTHDACSGDSHDISHPNAGNAPTYPTITIEPKAVKDIWHGPAYQEERIFAPTCVNPLTDPNGEGWPIMVKDAWNTAALVSSATVTQQLNGAIDDSQTTWAIDTAGGGGIPDGPFMAIVGTEQVYGVKAGANVTGAVRGIGGTTKASHGDNAVMYLSKALANGNDLRVWLDGVEVDRWFGTAATAYAWNGATTKVWINAPFPARLTATLKVAMTAGAPANGGDVEAVEDAPFSTWGPTGYFQVGGEVIYYGSRTDKVLSLIKRAQKTTTAATHAINASIYRLPHDIRLTYGWAGADSPPSSDNKKPMIDLATSDNTHFNWPGTATPAYSAPTTARTAQILRGYSPLNTLSSVLRAYESGGKLYVEDTPAASGMPQGDVWYFPGPTGITVVEHDVAVANEMLLDVWGNDGVADHLLGQYNPDTDGDDKTITPAATVYGVEYRAWLRTITACKATGGGPNDLNDSGGSYTILAQAFRLDQITTVSGFVVRLKKAAGVTGSVKIKVVSLDSTDGPSTHVISQEFTINCTAIGTGFADFLSLMTNSVSLPAGDYALSVQGVTLSGVVSWDGGVSSRTYPRGNAWNYAASWTERDQQEYYFYLLGDGSVSQTEAPSGSSDECTVDNLRLTLANVWGTIAAGGETACYLADATIENAVTGLAIVIKLPMSLNEVLTIDCENETAILTGNGESAAYGVTFPDEPFYLNPGADATTYEEDGMMNTDLAVTSRDKYE